jgi:membrane protein
MSLQTGEGPATVRSLPSDVQGEPIAKSGRTWWSRARAAVATLAGSVGEHDLPRHAAALTYYLVLALFPVLIVVTALLGLVGLTPAALQSLLDAVAQLGSPWAVEFVRGVLDSVLASSGTPLLLSVGVLMALWTASGYVAAFMWAAAGIADERDTRRWFSGLAVRLGLALLLAVLLALAAMVVVLATPFAQWLGDLLGIGETAVQVWTTVDWPLFFAFAVGVFLLLYRAAPHSHRRRVLHDLTGACCGVAVWLVASAVFSFYLANFASYDRVYGVLGTGIAFLVWAWILDLTLLVGLELSLALGRRRGPKAKDDAVAPAGQSPAESVTPHPGGTGR